MHRPFIYPLEPTLNNPYSAPSAEFSGIDASGETYEPRVFSLSGRIGRLRYISYSWVTSVLASMVAGVLIAVLGMSSTGATITILSIAIYLPVIVFGLIMAKRRLNDLDKSGWIAILMIIPILNFFLGLYLIFASGTIGPNEYGPAPAKNSRLVVAGALVIPLVAIIGILAAIALPAYQGYVVKAKAAQAQTSGPQQ